MVKMEGWPWMVVVCALVVFPARAQEEDLVAKTQRCLQCICEGASKCDETAKCTDYGGDAAVGQVCGPFQITREYWEDAGKPGKDFISCVNTRSCSETAVINYMERYGRDCDGDKQVTCSDYARIHTAGVSGCDGPWVELTRFWTAFSECDKAPVTQIETRAMLRRP